MRLFSNAGTNPRSPRKVQSLMMATDGLISGDRTLARDQLTDHVTRAASALCSVGVAQGDVVALLLRNDFSFFEATGGAALLGASTVPLNWHMSAEEIEYILRDCGAKVLVGHTDLLTPELVSHCRNIELIKAPTPAEVAQAFQISGTDAQLSLSTREWGSWIASQVPWTESPRQVVGPMFYTSGTTGRPKGVKRNPVSTEVSERAEQRSRIAFGLDGSPVRSVLTGPLYHSAPNAYAMRVLMDGGLLVMQPRFDAEELLALIEKHAITHLHMVPTMFVRLLALPIAARQRHDLSSLKFVSHGAAPCPPDIKHDMIDWWGSVIFEYYAMTETGIIACCDSDEWIGHKGSVGKPVMGIQLVILDETGEECQALKIGEICVKSEVTDQVSYHEAPGKTAAMRRGGFIATGDLGYLDEDGFLFITDRKTDLVISGGVNIYPAQLENVLTPLAGINDCAFLGIPDREFGERLVAVIDCVDDLKDTEIMDHLRSKVGRDKLPSRLFRLHQLPREDSGKIKKRQLRDLIINGKLG